jgi:hypothetical protein
MSGPDDLVERLQSFAADYNLDATDTVRGDGLTNEAADRIAELERVLIDANTLIQETCEHIGLSHYEEAALEWQILTDETAGGSS